MSKTFTKSRTFAVVLTPGAKLGVYYLWTKTDRETGQVTLEYQAHETKWPQQDKDDIIELLKKSGMTVRYFDPEEKIWSDVSLAGGVNAAPGGRDGQWSFPNLEEFERDYLAVN